MLKKIIKYFILIFLSIILIFSIYFFSKNPSLYRNWNIDQKILPEISFSWNIINIKNIRNFKYKTISDYKVDYYNKSFDLSGIESMYYIIEPFSKNDWPAHTMVSFWFKNGDFITFSPEIRKEVWEKFSPFLWLINEYEMVYMIWDENDLVKLRANYRKDDVIMYPIKTNIDKIKSLFISFSERSQKLSKKPEFYNTLTNNCATSILYHANLFREEKISWSKEALLPSHSDKIIYDLWLIDTNLALDEARKYYKINELSEKYADDINYSKKIRKEKK